MAYKVILIRFSFKGHILLIKLKQSTLISNLKFYLLYYILVEKIKSNKKYLIEN